MKIPHQGGMRSNSYNWIRNALRKIDLYVHWHYSSLSQLWPKRIWASSLVWTFLWVDLANSTLLMQQNVGQTLTFRNSEKDKKKIFVKYLGQASIRCPVGSLNSGRLKVNKRLSTYLSIRFSEPRSLLTWPLKVPLWANLMKIVYLFLYVDASSSFFSTLKIAGLNALFKY